ncbi:MAG: choline/ethanolamine kinase family protein [Candidatus Paceibacterota bacterium]|jgi:thiamine kinase
MQDHLEIIKGLRIWGDRAIRVKKLSGGITNFNYLVQDGREKYVARFAQRQNTLLGLNRKREIYNTNIGFAVGAGPEVVRFFPARNLLIVKYIEGQVFSPAVARAPAHIRSIAKLIKKVHEGKKFQGTFNPFKTIRAYIATAQRHKSWLPDNIDELLAELAAVEKALGKLHTTYPCHLDLVIQNIVGTKKGVRLLDWEYAANSDYRFDLAMVSVMGRFTPAQDKALLAAYGIKNKEVFGQIERMKSVVCFREGAWGLLQLGISKIDFDYKSHAQKYLTLFQSYNRKANRKQ